MTQLQSNLKENKPSVGKYYPIIFGILIGLFMAGLILLLSGNSKPSPILINPTPTKASILVQIQGEVLQPGIYELQPGSRVIEVISLAGGFSESANQTVVNGAAYLHDGQSILIPSIINNDTQDENAPSDSSESNIIYPININQCTQDELEALPGIGPQKAAAIMAYREQNGDFSTIEDIMQVPGIGETIFNALQSLITTK